jgi:hypothetical protein
MSADIVDLASRRRPAEDTAVERAVADVMARLLCHPEPIRAAFGLAIGLAYIVAIDGGYGIEEVVAALSDQLQQKSRDAAFEASIAGDDPPPGAA